MKLGENYLQICRTSHILRTGHHNLGLVISTWQCISCGSFDITCTIFLTKFKVGLDYDGKVNLAVGNNKQFAGLLNGELGGDKSTSGKPMVVVLDENDKKYIMEEEFNSDMVSLRAFIDSYLAGNVEPFVKSEAVPESQVSLSFLRQILSMLKGANVKVVGKNFDEVVMNSDADVFLKMYAPWCGHCKRMAPAWEEFAESLKDDASVIVGEFDATSNDVGKCNFATPR